LVTLDKDFGELVVVRGLPHGGIVRLVGFAVAEQAKAALIAITAHHEALQAGALVTTNAKRVQPRIRPPEPKR
jgi:predicted nuclease of predicted toxin-antitoxin system